MLEIEKLYVVDRLMPDAIGCPAFALPTMPVPKVKPVSAAAWRGWLGMNHALKPAVWVEIAKPSFTGSPGTTLTMDQAVEQGLCYGWVEGVKRPASVKSPSYGCKFIPRSKATSYTQNHWTLHKRALVQKLIAKGKMQPAGLAAMELGRQSTRWDEMYTQELAAMGVPQVLRKALNQDLKASATFDGLSLADRFRICYQLARLEPAATKEHRTAVFVRALNNGDSPFQVQQRTQTRPLAVKTVKSPPERSVSWRSRNPDRDWYRRSTFNPNDTFRKPRILRAR